MNFSNESKCDIFSNISTYMDSYRKPNEIYRNVTKYTRAKVEKPIPKPPLKKDLENDTLTPFKSRVPYNLMIVPNEITGRHPYSSKTERVVPDDSIEKSSITRPKIYLTPQISLDDISDPKLKKLILDELYTSVSRKDALEFFAMVDIENSVFDPHLIVDSNIQHKYKINYDPKSLLRTKMTLQQTERGRIWTNQQKVSNTHETKHFWRNKKMKEIDPTFSSLIEKEVKNQITDSIRSDKISIAHDYTMPGYKGYKPLSIFGIRIPKNDFPVVHPYISTYQSVFNSRRDVRSYSTSV